MNQEQSLMKSDNQESMMANNINIGANMSQTDMMKMMSEWAAMQKPKKKSSKKEAVGAEQKKKKKLKSQKAARKRNR